MLVIPPKSNQSTSKLPHPIEILPPRPYTETMHFNPTLFAALTLSVLPCLSNPLLGAFPFMAADVSLNVTEYFSKAG